MFREIAACRLCGNPELFSILHMGEQHLTGVVPKSPDQPISRGPLELVKCHSAGGAEHCGLVQLRQSYDLTEMYGPNSGYRSSLNKSMIAAARQFEHQMKLLQLAERQEQQATKLLSL